MVSSENPRYLRLCEAVLEVVCEEEVEVACEVEAVACEPETDACELLPE
jgi:hypothetical protein